MGSRWARDECVRACLVFRPREGVVGVDGLCEYECLLLAGEGRLPAPAVPAMAERLGALLLLALGVADAELRLHPPAVRVVEVVRGVRGSDVFAAVSFECIDRCWEFAMNLAETLEDVPGVKAVTVHVDGGRWTLVAWQRLSL